MALVLTQAPRQLHKRRSSAAPHGHPRRRRQLPRCPRPPAGFSGVSYSAAPQELPLAHAKQPRGCGYLLPVGAAVVILASGGRLW